MGKRLQSRLIAIAMALAVLALGACQGGPASPMDQPGSPSIASGAKPGFTAGHRDWKAAGAPAGELERHWQKWLDGPWGVAGVDYNDREIAVGYRRGAKAPAKLMSGIEELSQDERAANRPNAILRHDRSYEQLTDAIAVTYGIGIKHQVYNEYSTWASFTVEPGRDSQAILERIRADFADQLEFATFPGSGQGAWLPDDPDFLDYTGTHAAPEQMWGQHLIGCEQAWDYSRGDENIMIAVVDDAFLLSHEELVNTVLDPQVHFPEYNLDIPNNDNDVTPGDTGFSHGTRVVGLLAAEGDNARTIIGVAHNCRVLPVKIADSTNGHQWNTDFTVGLNLAIDLGVRVINASWGSGTPYAPMAEAAERAYNEGVLFAASALNGGSAIPGYPVAYEYVIGVGATGYLPDGSTMDDWEPDTRAEFSNYGWYTDMAAPGVWHKTTTYYGVDTYTDTFSGTSVSCPLVTGIAALIFSINPALSVDKVANALVTTGEPTQDFPIGTVLRLNAPAAIAEALRDPTVSGTVIDGSSQAPLAGATVGLSGVGEQVSDEDGLFSFEGVEEGSYTLSATHPQYNFDLDGGELVVGFEDITDLQLTGWRSDLPVLAGLGVAEGDVFGAVIGEPPVLDASAVWAANPDNAGKIVYTLDLAPAGQPDPYDLEAESTGPGPEFAVEIGLSVETPNQPALLSALPYHADGTPGKPYSLVVYIFNQLGDVNGDGAVDMIDLDSYDGMIGAAGGDAGYLPFYDSDLDGVVTEADAAAVGYHWSPPAF